MHSATKNRRGALLSIIITNTYFQGAELIILKRIDENWFEGRPVDSCRVGLIPAPYVDPIVGEIDENAKINRIDSELNLKIQELNELAMRL